MLTRPRRLRVPRAGDCPCRAEDPHRVVYAHTPTRTTRSPAPTNTTAGGNGRSCRRSRGRPGVRSFESPRPHPATKAAQVVEVRPIPEGPEVLHPDPCHLAGVPVRSRPTTS